MTEADPHPRDGDVPLEPDEADPHVDPTELTPPHGDPLADAVPDDGEGPAVGDPAVGDPAVGDPAVGDPAVGDPAEDVTPASDMTVEDLVDVADRVTRERDEYLDSWRRTQADFENYRKRIMKQQAETTERAAEALVEKLLPVLDACDGAVRHGAVEVEPVFASLLGSLEKEGLIRMDPAGEAFDPERHEAVMHEPGEGDTVVTDVMRAGYTWKGRVLRPAMVKVQG